MATTVRTVSSVKLFLLGVIFGVILVCIAISSSILALCSGYNGRDIRSPTQISACQSPQTETQNTEEPTNRNSRHLKWQETVPFLSFYKKGGKNRLKEKEGAINNEKENIIPPQDDFRSCLCRLVWNPLANSLNRKQSDNEETKLSSSESNFWNQSQAIERFPMAFTREIQHLSAKEAKSVQKMGNNVLESVPDFEQRSSLVPWGGPPFTDKSVSFDWYAEKKVVRGPSAPLDEVDGGNLFSSYLSIMKWPENLRETDFPFKLCKEKMKSEGKACSTNVAVQHTLEFRERYRPWLVTHGIKRANTNGLVYTRGFSPPYSENEDAGHAIVWLRLSQKLNTDDEHDHIFFVRSMIREFENAVAFSLQRSNGRLGKFNAVVDGEGFTWSSMPSLRAVKNLVAVLQDHFAGRLGVIILVNGSSICELLLKLFLPLITEEVRNKIVMLPRDKKERLESLEMLIGSREKIPTSLGGADDYVFNVDEYYVNIRIGPDEEALEYLTTMPYHA